MYHFLCHGSSILIFISYYFIPSCFEFPFYLMKVYKLFVNLLKRANGISQNANQKISDAILSSSLLCSKGA